MQDPKTEAALDEAVAKAAHMPRPAALATDAEALLGPAAAAPPPAPKGPAASAYDRLVLYIRNFESQLDADHEIAMGFAGSEAGVLKIEGLGYYDPDLITLYGRDEDGNKTQLIQHVTQLSVLLRAVPKPTEKPAHRIGFRLTSGWTGGESGDGSV
jgi:hypothetical protein